MPHGVGVVTVENGHMYPAGQTVHALAPALEYDPVAQGVDAAEPTAITTRPEPPVPATVALA